MFVMAVLPFAIEAFLAVFLWVRAGWLAGAFVPPNDGDVTASGNVGVASFRVLGLYYVISNAAWVAQVIFDLLSIDGRESAYSAARQILDIYRMPGLAILIEFVVGLVLLCGAGRMWQAISSAPSRVWRATSIGDAEQERE